MIIRMKKATVIVQDKDAPSAVRKMRSLGVLHPEHHTIPEGKDINSLNQDLSLINKVLAIFSRDEFLGGNTQLSGEQLKDWRLTAGHIVELHNRYSRLNEYSGELRNSISQWEAWGDFQPQSIKSLSEKNIFIKLYLVPQNQARLIPKDIIAKRLFARKGMIGYVFISQKNTEFLHSPVPQSGMALGFRPTGFSPRGSTFKEIPLPKMGLGEMRLRLSQDNQAMQAVKGHIRELSRHSPDFMRIKDEISKELEFQLALDGMGKSGQLAYLTGYAPYDKTELLLSEVRKEKWALLLRDPADDDFVPTLIRNPRWVSIINPVFKLIELVPGYRELDTSFWFLSFFSVFFGMIIGDAGYGAIFFALTIFAHRKWGRRIKDKSVFFLLYLLSTCAIVWGVLSATVFGQEWLTDFFRPLVPALRNDKFVQNLCFLLGSLHLSIAHLWQLIRVFPSVTFLAHAGWISLLWGSFFLAKYLISGDSFPAYGKWFFAAGAVLVIIFSSPKKNILKTIGSGLGAFLLNAANNFTDVVSYIRLFAVGLAGVAVADAFNNMARDIGFNNALTAGIAALILLSGHLLNIMLGPMSILVHGVRLNVLEFSNHLDIKWSGFAYKPLCERERV